MKLQRRLWYTVVRSSIAAFALPMNMHANATREKRLTLVHKCNVLTNCGDLWVRSHKEMGDAEFTDIKQDYNHVDACTMWMVKSPEFYDVIVTENLFGDIITDLGRYDSGRYGYCSRREHQSRRPYRCLNQSAAALPNIPVSMSLTPLLQFAQAA